MNFYLDNPNPNPIKMHANKQLVNEYVYGYMKCDQRFPFFQFLWFNSKWLDLILVGVFALLVGLWDFFTWRALHQVYTRFPAILCSSVNPLCPPEHITEYSPAWFGWERAFLPFVHSSSVAVKKLKQPGITNPTTTNCQIDMGWQTRRPVAHNLFGSWPFKTKQCVLAPLMTASAVD